MMRVHRISDYPSWLSDMLFTGNFDLVTMAYGFPVTYHFENRMYLIRTPAQMKDVLSAFRGVFLKRGLSGTSTRIVNRPAWFAERFTVSIKQRYAFGSGIDPVESRMRFFVERPRLRPQIRMVEVEEIPFAREITSSDTLKALRAA